MSKKESTKYFTVSLAVCLFLVSAASAVPTNGNFAAGLTGWTVESGIVSDGGGFAFFEEDPVSQMSSLSQEFVLPAGALELSFDRIMESIYDNGGLPTTDSFAVSLLDAATLAPLTAWDSGVSWFYYIDNSGDEYMVSDASLAGNMVTLDVSSFAGTDVLLAFDFFTENDGWFTTVALDNVNVSVAVVPAPGALLLSGFGIALIGWFRKTKMLA